MGSVKFLLAPKYVACLFPVLLLSFIFDVVGIFGGYIVGVELSNESSGSYFQGVYDAIAFKDVKMGI